jgi:aconitate hydratase
MVPQREGGFTRHHPGGEEMSLYEAAMRYRQQGVALVVVAGKEYGTGSSRDWAAKGPLLLGVRAIIAESFERIHRSNLIGMGILPLQFLERDTAATWQLDGSEVLDLSPPPDPMAPGQAWQVEVRRTDDSIADFSVLSRLDTAIEVAYIQAGGILQYVLANLAGRKTQG